jgi:phosphoribosylaminoimidazole-succinocarboxamide synthase
MTTIPPITSTDLPFPLFRRGKVRDVYDIGAYLLFVTTDRISAFDHILPNGIPYKGAILNSISDFWFRKTTHHRSFLCHSYVDDIDDIDDIDDDILMIYIDDILIINDDNFKLVYISSDRSKIYIIVC